MVAITSPGATTLPSGRSARESDGRIHELKGTARDVEARPRRRAGARATPAKPACRRERSRPAVMSPARPRSSSRAVRTSGSYMRGRSGVSVTAGHSRQTEIRFQRCRARRRARPQARWMTAQPRAGRRENRCGSARRGFPRADSGDCDHQSHQRGIGCRAAAAGDRIEAADRAFDSVPVAEHAEALRQDRPHGGRVGRGRRRIGRARFQRAAARALDALRHPLRTDDRFHQRIAGEPVGAMQPGAADFAAGPEAVRRCCGLRYPPISRPCGSAPPAAPESDRSRDRSRPFCRRRK